MASLTTFAFSGDILPSLISAAAIERSVG